MILSEAIINCRNYEDTEEMMYSIYAKRIDGKFQPNSEALVIELTIKEMELKWNEISQKKCPEFDYFLEMFVLRDLYDDLTRIEEYKSDIKKVERVIYYAEFDA